MFVFSMGFLFQGHLTPKPVCLLIYHYVFTVILREHKKFSSFCLGAGCGGTFYVEMCIGDICIVILIGISGWG